MSEPTLTEKIQELAELAREEGYARGKRDAQAELDSRGGDVAMARLASDILQTVAGHTSPAYAALIRRHAELLRGFVEAPAVSVRTHTGKELHLEFTQPMDGATLWQHVKVAPASGGPALTATAKWDPGSSTLVVSPTKEDGFTKGVEYRVTVAGEATTVAGVPFGDEAELTFTAR